MKAVLWTRYGSPDGLRIGEVEKPTPKDDEVLVKVRASTVTAGDCEVRGLKLPIWLTLPMRGYIGLFKPRRITILGNELAGDVEAVGEKVTRFKAGDAVFGIAGFAFGAYAEYVCLRAASDMGVLAIKPANVSYEEAAAISTGGLEALHFLRKAKVQPGETILINGAGGSIGTFGTQLAKLYGARVIAVDSGPKLDLLRELGADDVIDYTQADFTQRGETYDVIFDVIGKSHFSRSIEALNDGGRYLIANPRLGKMLRAGRTTRRTGKQVIFEQSNPNVEDLNHLKGLIEAEKLKTIVDRSYPLEQTAEAHRYVESGQKMGNVIITVAGE